MKFSRLKFAKLRWLLLCCWLAAGFSHPAEGQIVTLKKAAESLEPSNPTPLEKPDASRTRLEQWRLEARETLAHLEAPGAAAALPEGITAEELENRRRDLEQMVLTTTRALKNLSAIADARKDLETSRAKDAAWKGFKEQPPYSLLMVDDLLNERDALQANLSSAESSLSNYEGILANLIGETKAAEEAVSNTLGEVQKATAGTLEAAKWRLEATRAKARLLATRVDLIQNIRDSLKDRIASTQIELTLLERQVTIAKGNSRLNDDDLSRIGKVAAERQQTIRKEIDGVAKRLKSAMTTRTQAQVAMDARIAQDAAAAELPDMELAKYRVEVAEDRVAAMQSLIEGLESLLQLEHIGVQAYQDRRALIEARNPEQRAKMLESLWVPRERLWALENVLDDELSNSSAELSKIETRAASIKPEDPCFNLLNEQRSSTSEKLAMLQRVSQAVNAQRKLVKRWVIEYTPDPAQAGMFARLSTLGANGWATVKKIWSFKVMAFEDKVEVEGKTITGEIPVTLGILLRALLFFFIGYWIASIIAQRIQSGLVTRGRIAEAQAKTLRNWAMIVVGVFLVIGTLAFLKIPLTVFAFFGGALAIGLGFGTQTLIKNFISGIIVLAERKVRVGDILDVDGIIGTVTEINTRSSVIRSADDVETMIPNSAFLDNRVTNWTLSNAKMRRNLRVGVAYGTPPPKVMAVLTESAGRHGLICKDPAPFAVFEDFGESTLVFQLYFWLDLGGATNALIVASDLRLIIEKRFAEMGIGVPFPQRDVRLTTENPLRVEWAANPAPPPDPYK